MTHQQESGKRPKPELYNSCYAEWFKDPDVIAAYASRPPYIHAAIEFLSELTTDRPRRVALNACRNALYSLKVEIAGSKPARVTQF